MKNEDKKKDDAENKEDKKLPFVKKSDDEDEDDKKKDKEMDKALISEADLEKSLSALEQVTKSGKPARKQELLQKSLSGLASAAEQEELSKMLLAKSDDGLTTQISKSLAPEGNETFEKALEVSDYLGEMHKSLTGSLTAVAEAIEKSETKREERELVLAKALLDIGKLVQQDARLIKSLQSELAKFAAAPARAPKTLGLVGASADIIEKSDAGESNGKVKLSKSDVQDTLDEMISKGFSSASGRDILMAATQFEVSGQIDPQLLREVVSFRKQQS